VREGEGARARARARGETRGVWLVSSQLIFFLVGGLKGGKGRELLEEGTGIRHVRNDWIVVGHCF